MRFGRLIHVPLGLFHEVISVMHIVINFSNLRFLKSPIKIIKKRLGCAEPHFFYINARKVRCDVLAGQASESCCLEGFHITKLFIGLGHLAHDSIHTEDVAANLLAGHLVPQPGAISCPAVLRLHVVEGAIVDVV